MDVAAVVRAFDLELTGSSIESSSLRATMVAGVHVDVDATAAFTASRSALAVVMMVVNRAYRRVFAQCCCLILQRTR